MSRPTLASIGARLQKARLAAGLSHKEAAVRAGVAEWTVCRVEKGEGFTVDTLLILTETYGINLAYLEDENGDA